jgi:hypothetical protein
MTGTEQIVCSSFGGMLAEIAWIGRYDSVGQYDEMRTKVLGDSEYQAALARDLFAVDDGDVHFPIHLLGFCLTARGPCQVQ